MPCLDPAVYVLSLLFGIVFVVCMITSYLTPDICLVLSWHVLVLSCLVPVFIVLFFVYWSMPLSCLSLSMPFVFVYSSVCIAAFILDFIPLSLSIVVLTLIFVAALSLPCAAFILVIALVFALTLFSVFMQFLTLILVFVFAL